MTKGKTGLLRTVCVARQPEKPGKGHREDKKAASEGVQIV